MSYSARMQRNHLYSVFFAPRGSDRMYDLGMQIAQQYLSPFDRLIGIIGEAGSGKSMFVKGMFPGLELTNDDEGVNVRPLPILNIEEGGFYTAHTYHLDIRFEAAFTQMHVLAEAILEAVDKGKRVIVEHFDLIYPFLKRNANLLIGLGEEIVVTRPTIFGPEPCDVANNVFRSIHYRKMAHSAEDLVEYFLPEAIKHTCEHGDVRHGFMLVFYAKPELDIADLERRVNELIAEDIPITYYDDRHVKIGAEIHPCTGPRTHVRSSGQIKGFRLLPEVYYDAFNRCYLVVGLVGEDSDKEVRDLNKIVI